MPVNVRLCPQKTKSTARPTATQPCPRYGPQRTAYRRPVQRQRSGMSGNEREYEISAPNRHSRTGGNPAPEMSGYARKKQNQPPVRQRPNRVPSTVPNEQPDPPVRRQRSETSGNEREYEISAPNRHSRIGGNPVPVNVRLRPQKNKINRPADSDPTVSPLRSPANSLPPACPEETLGNERK